MAWHGMVLQSTAEGIKHHRVLLALLLSMQPAEVTPGNR
jgi:hypothetical protein